MHYSNGGQHVQGTDHTMHLADVTCGNCKRTKAFKTAITAKNERGAAELSGIQVLADMLSLDGTTPATIVTVPTARSRYADAGFFTGFTGGNRQTSQNYSITGIFPDGSCEVTATGWTGTQRFLRLSDFLMWITPKGVNIGRILDCVIGDGMTWVAAMDLEYALEAERDSVTAIETAINDGFGIRHLSDTSHKVTTHEAPANGRTLHYADCSCGYGSGLYAEANDARDVAEGHGKVSRPFPDAPVNILPTVGVTYVMDDNSHTFQITYADRNWIGYRLDGESGHSMKAEEFCDLIVTRQVAPMVIAEDAEGAVKVWRASGSKVKSTSSARRFRKGA